MMTYLFHYNMDICIFIRYLVKKHSGACCDAEATTAVLAAHDIDPVLIQHYVRFMFVS